MISVFYTKKNTVLQFVKFGIVGLSNTVLSLALYYAGLWIGLQYILASVVGFILSVFNSYYWNHKYVFENNGFDFKDLMKTYMSYISVFILNLITMIVFVEVLGITDKVAPILNLVYSIPLNFILNKYFVFAERKE